MVKIVKFVVGILLQLKKQNTDNIKCWRRCGAIGILIHCGLECKVLQLLWQTVWQFVYKTKHTLTI